MAHVAQKAGRATTTPAGINPRLFRLCVVLAAILSIGTIVFGVVAAQDTTPAPLEPGKTYLDPADSERWTVSEIVLRREEQGRVSNAPPRSARRADVLNVMRTQANRGALLAGDIERDVHDLVNMYRYFTKVTPWLEIESREHSRLKLILVCTDPVIASISIRVLEGGWYQSAPPDVAYEVRSALSLHEGESYSIDAVDQDIRTRLFENQKYIDIKEERAYREDGVHVTLRLVRSRSVERVVLAGVFGQSRSTIEEELSLKDYHTANPNLVAKIDQTLRDSYIAQGFAFVDVTHEVVAIPRSDASNGEGLLRDRLARDNPTLKEHQLDQLMADAKEGETVLLVTVHEGPRVQVGAIRFVGIDKLADLPGSSALMPGTLPSSYWPLWYAMPWTTRQQRVERALFLVMAHGPTFFSPKPDFVMTGAVQDASFIQQHLRKAGWLDATVALGDVRYNDDRSRVELAYHIEPGPLYVLTGVALNVTTRPPLTKPDGTPEAQAVTDEDIWEALDLEQLQPTKDGLGIALGAEYEQRSLAAPIPYSRYHFEGDPLAIGARGARARIEALFGKLGYSRIGFATSEVFLERASKVAGTPTELAGYPGAVVGVVLTVDLDQGYRYRVGNVIIRGNNETKTRVLRAHLRLYPGEMFNIDEMRRAADRLRRLSWFDAASPGAGVQIQPVYPPVPEHPTSDVLDVDILVEVKEGNTGSAQFSAGFSPGSGMTVQLSITKRNLDFLDFPGFTGAGQSLSLSIEPKLQERQRFAIEFTEPFAFGYPLGSSIELFAEDQDFGPYTRSRVGGRFALGYTFYRDLAVMLKYHNFSEEISNISPSAPFEIRRDEGKSRFGAFSLEADYNRLNRYLFPSDGYRLTAETLVAADFFGGNFNMWRMGARAEKAFLITPLDELRDISFTSYALVLWQDAFEPTDRVPLSNRLTLGSVDSSPFRGGRSTTALRGFRRGGVGPSAGGDPVGGNFLVNASAEVALPLQANFFWLIGFVDVGEVVPEIENFDPSGLTASTGFGFRIQLPIFPAPFGVDFGWPIYSHPGSERELVTVNLQLSF